LFILHTYYYSKQKFFKYNFYVNVMQLEQFLKNHDLKTKINNILIVSFIVNVSKQYIVLHLLFYIHEVNDNLHVY